MKKILLMVLSLLVVSMFLVGCVPEGELPEEFKEEEAAIAGKAVQTSPYDQNKLNSCRGDKDCWSLFMNCYKPSCPKLYSDKTKWGQCVDDCLDKEVKVECTDSDGDLGVFKKGTCIDATGSYTDLCTSLYGGRVHEYYCGEDNLCAKEYYAPCLEGYVCEDGACVAAPECTDSDGGKDYYVKGSVKGLLDGEPNSRADHCGGINSELLEEFYCDGSNIAYVHAYKCPNGCVNGACIKVEEATPVPAEADCKIISAISSDYQWIWDTQPTPSEVCAKEGMVCGGVEEIKFKSYLDENGKIQAIDNENEWLSPYYCDTEIMGKITGGPITIDPEEYSEPYAGVANLKKLTRTVLCCK